MGWVNRVVMDENPCVHFHPDPRSKVPPLSDLKFHYERVWEPEENPIPPRVEYGFPEPDPQQNPSFVSMPGYTRRDPWRVIKITPLRRRVTTTWTNNANGQKMGRTRYEPYGVRKETV